MATNYDKMLTDVKDEERVELNKADVEYGNMIADTKEAYDKLIDQTEAWKDQQTEIQNQKTDFAIEQIEQQKEQTQKNYIKEQSGAYVDWQKQSDQYGANAEKIAAGGLANTGFAESSQVSMYNTYQNRVATARASFEQAKLNFANAIDQAILQNSSILAEIAAQAFQKQSELALQSIQYQNQLLTQLSDKKFDIKKFYADEYQRVLNQMNTEKALAEEQRQYNLTLAEQQRQYDASLKLQREQFEWEKGQANKTIGNTTGNTSIKDVKQISGGRFQKDKSAELPKELDSQEVSTAYYKGSLNPDATKYGVMSNGYQPKGISGHGTLKKTGHTVRFNTQTLYGQKQTLVQNIWEAEDGTWWRWEGRLNKYIQVRKPKADGT